MVLRKKKTKHKKQKQTNEKPNKQIRVLDSILN